MKLQTLAFVLTLSLAGSAYGEPALTFEHDVQPILKAHCTLCHGEEAKPKGGVDLRLRRFMDLELDGGEHVVVAGKPGESELIRIVRSGEMPEKGKKLTAQQIAVIERWIAQGAKTARPEPEKLAPGTVITDEDRSYWAFQPIVRPLVPAPENGARARSPIDAFVLAKLREQGLDFAPEADKHTLLRRVTFDLTGLPPLPEEVDAFVKDAAPDAYEKVVDRLLASPAYGERWARQWLDAAGYADTNGYAEADSPRPNAYRYREYVIRAFNADKPWNQFIVEQLAGDELAQATQDDYTAAVHDPMRREEIIATGFLRMGPDGTGDAVPDPRLARNQVIADEIKIVSSSLLGLTVACAQCHDHRYDPITQADYYRFRAIFDPAYDWEQWRTPAQREYSLGTAADRAKAAEIESKAKQIDAEAAILNRKLLDEIFELEIVKLPETEREPFRIARSLPEKDRTPEQQALFKKYPKAQALNSLDLYDSKREQILRNKQAEAARLRATKPREETLMALMEVKGRVPATRLLHRGDHDQPKQPLGPGELSVLAQPAIDPFVPAPVASGSSGRRLAYARWLTSGQHPLVARVLVNRFWMQHFQRGIVNTPGNFGVLGERPTHPELLDWLATEFMQGGWRLKPLQRQIVLSATYRQASRNDAARASDPDNRLLARFPMRRMDAETVRDSILAAAGVLQGSAPGANEPRSVYLGISRKNPVEILETFDAPQMLPNCDARTSTTVTPQSLLLMNDHFILGMAKRLAERARKESPGDVRGQIARIWRLLYAEEAEEKDLLRSLAYVAEQTETLRAYFAQTPGGKGAPPDASVEALASLCQVLLGSNRFLYIE